MNKRFCIGIATALSAEAGSLSLKYEGAPAARPSGERKNHCTQRVKFYVEGAMHCNAQGGIRHRNGSAI